MAKIVTDTAVSTYHTALKEHLDGDITFCPNVSRWSNYATRRWNAATVTIAAGSAVTLYTYKPADNVTSKIVLKLKCNDMFSWSDIANGYSSPVFLAGAYIAGANSTNVYGNSASLNFSVNYILNGNVMVAMLKNISAISQSVSYCLDIMPCISAYGVDTGEFVEDISYSYTLTPTMITNSVTCPKVKVSASSAAGVDTTDSLSTGTLMVGAPTADSTKMIGNSVYTVEDLTRLKRMLTALKGTWTFQANGSITANNTTYTANAPHSISSAVTGIDSSTTAFEVIDGDIPSLINTDTFKKSSIVNYTFSGANEGTQNFSGLFTNNTKLTGVSVSAGVCQSLTSLETAFENVSTLTSASFFGSLPNVASLRYAFGGTSVPSFTLAGLAAVTNLDNCFNGCAQTTEIKLTGLTVISSMQNVFQDSGVINLNIEGTNNHTVTNFYQMCYNCAALKNLTIKNIGTLPTATNINMGGWLSGCTALENIVTENVDLTGVTNLYQAFKGLTALEEVDFSGVTIPGLTAAQEAFSGCTGLVTVNLSNIDASAITNFYNIFYDCGNLTNLTSVKNISSYLSLSSCPKLTAASIQSVIDNLATVTNAQSLLLNSASQSLVTTEMAAAATAKNWTISYN